MPRRSLNPSPRSRPIGSIWNTGLPKTHLSIHDIQNELFWDFVNGSGILTVGGTLVDAKRTNGNNQRGSGIQGGTEIPVSKGDIYIVPQNTPHMLTPTGGPLVDLSLHLPGSPK